MNPLITRFGSPKNAFRLESMMAILLGFPATLDGGTDYQLYCIYMSLLSIFSSNGAKILLELNDLGALRTIIVPSIAQDPMCLSWPIKRRVPLHLLGNRIEVNSGIRIGYVWT